MWIVLSAVPLDAHLDATGLGPVYDGALHLLFSPEDLIPTLAIALLAGLRGARYGRVALVALPAAWLAGGLAGMAAGRALGGGASVVSFLLVGMLVATDARLPLGMLAGLTIVLGLVHGFVNGAGMDAPGNGAPALIGLTAVLFVLVGLVAAFVIQLRQSWSRVAVRVVGSWIAASGLLMLGWTLHRGR
jgi:hydrogenase/urease accessory protein HupE